MLRPAETAVAVTYLHVGVAQVPTTAARKVGQRRMPFDRVDLADHPGQHRGRVSGAGADLEHSIPFARLDGADHEGHDIGLGDRLILFNRQRGVFVGELRELRRQEGLSRDHLHRVGAPADRTREVGGKKE